MDVIVLVVAFVVILVGAELFTNGIEWFGHKLQLAEGAVGSVLAAVGTALPETMIPIIAILFTGGTAHEVGVGAILGAPFMLATLAMFVTGIAVLIVARRARQTDVMAVNVTVLGARHDGSSRSPTAWPSASRSCRATITGRAGSSPPILLGLYAWYVRMHLRGEASTGDPDLNALRFHRFDRGAPSHRRTRGCASSRSRCSSPSAASSAGRRSSWGRSTTWPSRSASTRPCWRSSSRRSRPSCRRSSTR